MYRLLFIILFFSCKTTKISKISKTVETVEIVKEEAVKKEEVIETYDGLQLTFSDQVESTGAVVITTSIDGSLNVETGGRALVGLKTNKINKYAAKEEKVEIVKETDEVVLIEKKYNSIFNKLWFWAVVVSIGVCAAAYLKKSIGKR